VTDEEKWEAVRRADASADGAFYYAVRSTGVFCRPSCRSKKPAPGNIRFFDRAEDALDAGYRPCKRCRPDLHAYAPDEDVVARAKAAIELNLADRRLALDALNALGLTRHRLDQVFRAQTGVSPAEYLNQLRLDRAALALKTTGQSTLAIAQSLGFENPSAFAAFFKKRTGEAPRDFRRQEHAAAVYDTVVGPMTIADDGEAIVEIRFGRAPWADSNGSPLTDRAAAQLGEYFAGERTRFDLPVSPRGTPFQRAVWRALAAIPYGETRSYAQVAAAAGSPGACRAAGTACRENPVPILIPCHRAMGSDGSLRGYAGGLALKKRLLALEKSEKPTREETSPCPPRCYPSTSAGAREKIRR
jgi:AraC family transcriptional regulator of adaptative response/methylated-DNA-[protein]-cysteine methyltransferase